MASQSFFLEPPFFAMYQSADDVKHAKKEGQLNPGAYTWMTEKLYVEKHEAHNAAVLEQLQKNTSKKETHHQTLMVYNLNGGGFLRCPDKVFGIFQTTGADILCLSETLVPNDIAEESSTNPGHIIELHPDAEADNVFEQPYGSIVWPDYAERKLEKNSGKPKKVTYPWAKHLYDLGFRYLLFSNPKPCPWGSNWGNVILTKQKPTRAAMWNLPTTTNKPGGKDPPYDEARTLIGIQMKDVGYVFMTHLENNDQESRVEQAKRAVEYMRKFVDGDKEASSITMTGDFNSLHADSYTVEEQKMLVEAWYPPRDTIPREACDTITQFIGSPPLNSGQKFESKFQKCVTHGWSTGYYTKAMMYFSDAMDFDHQPLLLTTTCRSKD